MIVLLATRPGSLRDGLTALLSTIPDVGLVAQANNSAAVLDFVAEQCAELMLVEVRPGKRGALEIIPQVRSACPNMQIVALVVDEKDREATEESGADVVLSAWVPAPRLREVITELVVSSTKDSSRAAADSRGA